MFAPVTLLAVVALSHVSPAQDTVVITRIFKEKEAIKYAFAMDADMGGQQIKGTAAIEGTVSKLLEKGKAELIVKLKDVKLDMGGGAAPDSDNGETKLILNANNLPDSFVVEGTSFISGLWAISGYVPNKALKSGETTDFTWEADDKSATVSGKCKLAGCAEEKGIKVANFELAFSVTPNGQKPGAVKLKTKVDQATGALLESSGTIDVEGEGLMNVSFKKQ